MDDYNYPLIYKFPFINNIAAAEIKYYFCRELNICKMGKQPLIFILLLFVGSFVAAQNSNADTAMLMRQARLYYAYFQKNYFKALLHCMIN